METIYQQTLLTPKEKALPVTTWDPLQYFSPEELSRLDERFDYALQNVTCLVFWTGVSLELAENWAKQHGVPTLTIAMGPLFSDRDIGGARYGKSPKAWSKYMKGASGRFAEYACRGNRQSIVLTRPPPDIYSSRKQSNYRHLEEPILKGVFGGPGTARIEYVHPTVKSATTFQYQTWPLDSSSTWDIFYKSLPSQRPGTYSSKYMSTKVEVLLIMKQKGGVVVQVKPGQPAQNKRADPQEMQQKTEIERQKTREKKEANRKRAEQEQQKAQEKKMAKRKKVEMEQQMAQKRKEARRKKAEMEQRMAQEKKAAKRRSAEMKQRQAQEKKAAKRKKAEKRQRKVQKKKAAKRRKAEEIARKIMSMST